MQIIKDKISIKDLEKHRHSYGDFVKAVVDIEKEVMAIGGEMHADEEKLLLGEGSKQENLWGINIYLEADKGNRIEFDSMINIRPWQDNRSRSVENPEIQKKIIQVTEKLICD